MSRCLRERLCFLHEPAIERTLFLATLGAERVFNITVENSVEKYASIFLSGSVDRWFSILHRGEGWHFRGVLKTLRWQTVPWQPDTASCANPPVSGRD